MAQRKVPALNASSMADVSFLLLCFFLMVSNMDVDSGLPRRLPQPPRTDEKTSIDVQRRNLLVVNVNSVDEVMVSNQQGMTFYNNVGELGGTVDKPALKDIVKEFVLNVNNSSALPELEEQDFGPPIGIVPVTAQHVISVANDATTSYKAYIAVQNEIVKAYNELRNDAARKYYGMTFDLLTEEQQSTLGKLYPLRISEAEPKNYGKIAERSK